MKRTFIETINKVWSSMKSMDGWDLLDDLLVEDLIATFDVANARCSWASTSANDAIAAFTVVVERVLDFDPEFQESDDYHFMLNCLAELN